MDKIPPYASINTNYDALRMRISFFFESNTCVLICFSFGFMRRISPHFWSCEGCTATGKCNGKVNQFYTEKFVQNISLIIKSIYNLHTLPFFSPCILSDNGFNECAGIGSANYQFSKKMTRFKKWHMTQGWAGCYKESLKVMFHNQSLTYGISSCADIIYWSI